MWRVIPGFENYEVSEEGRVRSLARLVQMKNGRNRWCEGQILAQMPIPAPITYGSTCTATAKGPRSCWSTVWCYGPRRTLSAGVAASARSRSDRPPNHSRRISFTSIIDNSR